MAKNKNTMKKRIITSAGAAAIALGGAGVLPMTAALLPQATAATQGTNFYTSNFFFTDEKGNEISETEARKGAGGNVRAKFSVTFSAGAPKGTVWSLDDIPVSAIETNRYPDRTVEKEKTLEYDVKNSEGKVNVRVILGSPDNFCDFEGYGGYTLSGDMRLPVNSSKDADAIINSINSKVKIGAPSDFKTAVGDCADSTTPNPPETEKPSPGDNGDGGTTKPPIVIPETGGGDKDKGTPTPTPDKDKDKDKGTPTPTPDKDKPGGDKPDEDQDTPTPTPDEDEETPAPTPTPDDAPPPSIDDILPPSDDADEDTDEGADGSDVDEDSTDNTNKTTQGHTQGGQVASPGTAGNGFSDGSKSSLPEWRKSDGGESISIDDDDKVGPEVKTGGSVKSASVFDKIKALFS